MLSSEVEIMRLNLEFMPARWSLIPLSGFVRQYDDIKPYFIFYRIATFAENNRAENNRGWPSHKIIMKNQIQTIIFIDNSSILEDQYNRMKESLNLNGLERQHSILSGRQGRIFVVWNWWLLIISGPQVKDGLMTWFVAAELRFGL